MQPDTLRASLPSKRSIQYGKAGAKDMVEEGTLAGTLRAEDRDVEGGGREFLKRGAGLVLSYFIWLS